MMIKLFGAMMIFTACAMLGLYQAAAFENRVKQLRQLIQAFQRLETEIDYGFTPLPAALEKISSTIQEPVAAIFRLSAAELRQNNGSTTIQSWKDAVNTSWHKTSMKAAEKDVVLQFGSTLGISDRKDQMKHIHLAKNQLQAEEMIAKEEQLRYAKMWKSLGVLGGVFIVIMMY